MSHQIIRQLIKEIGNPDLGATYRQNLQVARFLKRSEAYATHLHKPSKKGKLARITDDMLLEAFSDDFNAISHEGLFSIFTCWLVMNVDQDGEAKRYLRDLYETSDIFADSDNFQAMLEIGDAMAGLRWEEVGVATRQTNRTEQKVDPKEVDENTAAKVVEESQPVALQGAKEPVGIPTGEEKADIPIGLWAKMVEHLKQDAQANKGMFSISTVRDRFSEKLPRTKRPVDFLRLNETKEQIELMAKWKSGQLYNLPRDQKVEGIPDIPEVIYNCPVRGWCVCEALFLDYAMFISPEFKLAALDILRQASSGTMPTDGLAGALKEALAPMFSTLNGIVGRVGALEANYKETLQERDVAQEAVKELDTLVKEAHSDPGRLYADFPEGYTNESRMITTLKEVYGISDAVAKLITKLWERLCRWYELHYVINSCNRIPGDDSMAVHEFDYTTNNAASSYYTRITYSVDNLGAQRSFNGQKPYEAFSVKVMAALLSGANWKICNDSPTLITSPLSQNSWGYLMKGNMRSLVSPCAIFLKMGMDSVRMPESSLVELDELFRRLSGRGMELVNIDLTEKILKIGGGRWGIYCDKLKLEDRDTRRERQKIVEKANGHRKDS